MGRSLMIGAAGVGMLAGFMAMLWWLGPVKWFIATCVIVVVVAIAGKIIDP